MVTYSHNRKREVKKMNGLFILALISLAIAYSQAPIVIKDFWQEIKEIYNIK